MALATEAQLINQIKKGDRAALGDLLHRYQNRLFNIILRMVNHRDDAEEVTAEAMLKIVQGIHSYRGSAPIATWMIRIAMNAAISFRRKHQLRRTTSLDAPGGLGTGRGGADMGSGQGVVGHVDQSTPLREQIADHRKPGPEQSVQQRQTMAQLQIVLERLEVKFQTVLVLRDIDEMDYPQIAETLGIPIGTVKSRLFRARLSLRHEMLQMTEPTSAATKGREKIL